jgi:DNA-binding NarL/FixJ family response regulator
MLGANEAAYELLGRDSNSLEGVPVVDLVTANDRAASEAALVVLRSAAIEGYRAVRHFMNPDGREFTANIWVRETQIDGKKLGLLTIEPETAATSWPLIDTGIKIALVVTDHHWTIELVSSDIEQILGRSRDSYEGSALLGLLQPVDVQDFMSAVDQVTADGGGATLRTHFRSVQNQWQDVWCLILAMCQHSPPRLGLVITAIPEFGVEMTPELNRQLAVLGGDALGGMERFQSLISSGDLSTRQWEILMRLVHGERVSDIAAALFLSPSTVRNHLTAIYKKFGVHSQAGLLAKLLDILADL